MPMDPVFNPVYGRKPPRPSTLSARKRPMQPYPSTKALSELRMPPRAPVMYGTPGGTALDLGSVEAERAARAAAAAPRPATQVPPRPGVMYGTPQGVALDLGAAEGARANAAPRPSVSTPRVGRDPRIPYSGERGVEFALKDTARELGIEAKQGGKSALAAKVAPTSKLATAGRLVSRAAAPLGALSGGYELGTGIREGDATRAAFGAGDLVASGALLTPAAPVAGAYLAGRAAYGLGQELPEDMQDTLGSWIDPLTGGRTLNATDRKVLGGLTATGLPLTASGAIVGRGPKPVAAQKPSGREYDSSNFGYEYGETGRPQTDAYNVMEQRPLRDGESPGEVGILRERFTGDASQLPGVNQLVGKGRKYTVNNEAFARESNYVDEHGRPVTNYSDTRQYKEGVLRAQKDQSDLAKMAAAHALSGDRNRAYALAMGNPDAEAAVADALELGDLRRKAQAGSKSARAALAQRQTNEFNMYKANLEARDRAARLGFDQAKTMAELGMKGQELGLRREDLGLKRSQDAYTRAKDLRDYEFKQGEAGMKDFKEATTIYGPDGQIDRAQSREFANFVTNGEVRDENGKLMQPFDKLDAAGKRARIAAADTAWRLLKLQQKKNASTWWFGKKARPEFPLQALPVNPLDQKANLADWAQGLSTLDLLRSRVLPFTDPNVRRYATGKPGEYMPIREADLEDEGEQVLRYGQR